MHLACRSDRQREPPTDLLEMHAVVASHELHGQQR